MGAEIQVPWIILFSCQVTELELHPGFKCSLKKKKKKRKGKTSTNTYFYICITCIQKEGTAEQWLESGATFQTPKMTSAISKAPGPRVSHLTPDKGPSLVFQEIKLHVSWLVRAVRARTCQRRMCNVWFYPENSIWGPHSKGQRKGLHILVFPNRQEWHFLAHSYVGCCGVCLPYHRQAAVRVTNPSPLPTCSPSLVRLLQEGTGSVAGLGGGFVSLADTVAYCPFGPRFGVNAVSQETWLFSSPTSRRLWLVFCKDVRKPIALALQLQSRLSPWWTQQPVWTPRPLGGHQSYAR